MLVSRRELGVAVVRVVPNQAQVSLPAPSTQSHHFIQQRLSIPRRGECQAAASSDGPCTLQTEREPEIKTGSSTDRENPPGPTTQVDGG